MKRIIKHIFLNYKIFNLLFKFIKKLSLPVGSFYQYLRVKGIIEIEIEKDKTFKMISSGEYIENELFWKGIKKSSFEKTTLAIFQKLAQNSKFFVDIGANTGVFTLVAKTINKDIICFAFEPVSLIYDRLEKNLKLNGITDVVLENKAVSNYDGVCQFQDAEGEDIPTSLTILTEEEIRNKKTIEVQCVTLDSYFSNNLQNMPIDLVKMDVETFEPQVIEGMKSILTKYEPTLIVEILDDNIGKQIKSLLSEYSYIAFSINEKTGEVKQKVDFVRESSSCYNYLFISKNKVESLNLFKSGGQF
jgi:FkbM family methyltransferase